MEEREISDVVSDFIENMEAINDSTPYVLSVVATLASKLTSAHKEYLEKYASVAEESEDRKVYSVPVERQGRVKRLRDQSSSLRTSVRLIPRNFLVSYVSEFDCFLGSLLKVIYLKKPELFNDSSRQITYSELLSYVSLEDAKNQVLEKEIESIIRKSHAEHFAILENKFDIKLRKGLEIWKEFIEITERRNLFVHSNGAISAQYLKVCRLHGCDMSSMEVGQKLTVSSEYLQRAYNVIYEISVKLAHVLWRKLFPDEREKADNNLNNLCFNLIQNGKNELASELLEFSISLPKHHNDTVKRMMVINLAQAYKRSDRQSKCEALLGRFDWSATGYNFKLAVAVLENDYLKASKFIKTVVGAGDLSEQEIVEWPLFKEFRKSEEFSTVFKELFNKDYAQQEELLREEFDTHMNDIFSLDSPSGEGADSESIKDTAREIEKEMGVQDA